MKRAKSGYLGRKLAIVVLALLLVLVMATLVWTIIDVLNPATEVKATDDLVARQALREKQFQISGYTIDKPNVIVNPYGNSPLTALIMFQTGQPTKVKITVPGKDDKTTFSHLFDSATDHYIPVYGLYPGITNKVQILLENGKTKTVAIKTKSLPKEVVKPTGVAADKSKLDGGQLYFFSPSSAGYSAAYDINGDVRWYLTQQASWDNTRLKNGHIMISTERLVNPPYYTIGLYESDLPGKIYAEYSLPGGYHHDYVELPNGNLLIASNDFSKENSTVEDRIAEMDRKTGKILRTIDLTKILDPKNNENENWTRTDWFHNNAVWYDQKTNSITLSGRHQDAVVNIDYDSLKINWILGDPTDWPIKYRRYFLTPVGQNFEWQWSQHAAMITPEGYVALFDNGNNKSKEKSQFVPAEKSYSRGVIYKIDKNNMTVQQLWQYGKERGSSFYSPYISDIDYYNSSHVLVSSGGIIQVNGKPANKPAGLIVNGKKTLLSDTVEIYQGQPIFELKLPTNTYRVEKMSPYADKENFQLGKAKQVGSLGYTKPTKTDKSYSFTSQDIDDNYKKHQIKITRQRDRVVVSGKFKRGQKVKLILRHNVINREYDIRVSKKPYSAMCVDIWSEDETKNGITVNKYVNNSGLSGRYNIFIEIDGTVYNTKQYVKF